MHRLQKVKPHVFTVTHQVVEKKRKSVHEVRTSSQKFQPQLRIMCVEVLKSYSQLPSFFASPVAQKQMVSLISTLQFQPMTTLETVSLTNALILLADFFFFPLADRVMREMGLNSRSGD